MSEAPALPPLAAVVVAAGAGLRAGQPTPKQFADWRGTPLVRHCVRALIDFGCDPLVLVVPAGMHDLARASVGAESRVVLVDGGETRQQSVRAGLEELAGSGVEHVLIHDAARPRIPRAVIERLLAALDHAPGAIPVLPVVDSIALEAHGLMAGQADRVQLRRVQTPQAFRFDAILAAHRAWTGETPAGDDAQVLRVAGGDVALVAGDERLKKITYAEDFVEQLPPVRVGTGYDVHRLAAGEELWLCGVHVPHDKGLVGHIGP